MRYLHFLLSRSVVVAGVLLASLLLAATPAAADMTPEQMADFEAHLQRGSGHLNEGNFEQAVEELDRARQLLDHPRISLRIVESYRQLQRCSAAEEEIEALSDRGDLSDDLREEVDQERGLLDACVETVFLEIQCSPQEARLEIEGQDWLEELSCPYAEDTTVETVVITARAEGYAPATKEVVLAPGVDRSVSFELEATAPEITEEDKPEQVVEEEPKQPEEAAPKEEPLKRVDELPIDDVDEDGPRWPRLVGFSAIGAGVVMIGGGAVLDYGANNRAAELVEARQQRDQTRIDELEATGANRQVMTGLLYGGGLVLMASGVALQFIDFSSSDDQSGGFSVQVVGSSISTTFRW